MFKANVLSSLNFKRVFEKQDVFFFKGKEQCAL